MRIIKTVSELRNWRRSLLDKKVGFVPTMGFLHQGHMSLFKLAKQDCDVAIGSIFVNPKQFAPHEDLDKYPRNLERDIAMMESEKVDAVFTPGVEDMYPKNFKTYVQIEDIDKISREGDSRPGFFKGVATVVTKLFNMVQPDKAYFGQKDGIQCIVIKKMVSDLNIPIEIVIGPTMREKDGLAMSSRNSYLSQDDRKIAPILYQALSKAKKSFEYDEVQDLATLLTQAKSEIETVPKVKLDYLNLVDIDSGNDIYHVSIKDNYQVIPTSTWSGKSVMMSGALWVGKTRLIDNVLLEPK